MKDSELQFDRRCHVLYTKACKAQIQEKIARHYPETEQEAVFINFEGFALKANFSHACPPWTFALFGPCGPSQTAEAYGVRLIPH